MLARIRSAVTFTPLTRQAITAFSTNIAAQPFPVTLVREEKNIAPGDTMVSSFTGTEMG